MHVAHASEALLGSNHVTHERGWWMAPACRIHHFQAIPHPPRAALTFTRWRQGTSESGDKAQGSLVYAIAASPTLGKLSDQVKTTSGCTNSARTFATRCLWGRGWSPHGAAVAWPLWHGIDHEVFEAVTQPAGAGEGERDFRV